jgi:hypothetical protein
MSFTRIPDSDQRIALMDFIPFRHHLSSPSLREILPQYGDLLAEAWSPGMTLILAQAVLSRISSEGVPNQERGTHATVLYEPSGVAKEIDSWDDICIFQWRPETNPRPSIPDHVSIYSLTLRLNMSAGNGGWRRAIMRMDFHEDDWVYVKLEFSEKSTPQTDWPLARLIRFFSRAAHPMNKYNKTHYRCDGVRGLTLLVEHVQRQSRFLP